MGWLESLIGGAISTGQQIYNNEFNKKEAEKNRDFQSDEAQKNRDFQSEEAELARIFNSNESALQRDWSSQEAERARDWNEEMYEKYNSLSGKIAQAEQAGVNPMFAITGNAVSPMSTTAAAPSGASASGASAGSVGTPSGASAVSQFVDIVGSILGMSKLKAEIRNIESQTDKNIQDTEHGKWLSALSKREYDIVTEHNFDIRKLESEIGLNHDQATKAFAEAGKAIEEAAKITAEKDFLTHTSNDREKIVQYERIMAEFDSGLGSVLSNLENGQISSLNEAVGAIVKAILLIRKN